ncbi:hypothetical protein P7C71_g4657, partial [Lecanoromycetidae sp. Uapishka_2]
MHPLYSLLPLLSLASAQMMTTTTSTTSSTTNAAAVGPAAVSASASSAAEAAAEASAEAAFTSFGAYASATGPIVDECGPTVPDPSVDDSCYTPVQEVDAPAAYGVQCLNDTISTPINITSCAELIPIMCAQEWQEPGQWLWITNNACSLGSFLPPYKGSATWPSAENCELLIYAAMVNECAYSGIPYNIAAVNLKTLPQNIGQGLNNVVGTGQAVNVGYGSYLIADRQLRNLSDADNCQAVPYAHAKATPVACAGGNGGGVYPALNIPIPGWLTPALVTPEATGALPRLEYLQLSGYANGLLFMAVLAYFAVPTLKKIALDRYEEWATENLELSAGWVSEENPSTLIDRALDYVRTPAIPSVHLRNLTTLTLSGPVAQPLVTEAITKWPARLLKFSLHGILHSNCAEQYTLSAVQQILNLHRESLQDIRLGIIPGGGQDIPDFSAFSDLQRLRLNTFNLMGISPLEASRKLAAPSLSYLHIEFETEDQHPEQVEDFATYEVRWLEEFVALLKPSGDTATSKLEKIFVGFLPIFALWYFPSTDDAPWPWDYLDEAAQVVTKRGVTLNYTTPTCTREDWDRMLSAKRNGETWPPEKEYEETDNEDELDSDEDDVDDEDDDDDESDNDN